MATNYDSILTAPGKYISFNGYAPQVGSAFGGTVSGPGSVTILVVNGVNGTQMIGYQATSFNNFHWLIVYTQSFNGIVNTSFEIPLLNSDPEKFYYVQADQKIWSEYQNNVSSWSDPLTLVTYGPPPTPVCFGTGTQIVCVDPSTRSEFLCKIEDIKKDHHHVKVLPSTFKRVTDVLKSKMKIDTSDFRKTFFSHKKDETCRMTGMHGVFVKSLDGHRCSEENALRIDRDDDTNGYLIPVASSNDFEKAHTKKDEEDYYHICVETDKGDHDFDIVFVGSNGDVLAETIQRVNIKNFFPKILD